MTKWKIKQIMKNAQEMTQEIKGYIEEEYKNIKVDGEYTNDKYKFTLPEGAKLEDNIFGSMYK